jgi:crotonobetainyl-CoA:carnitine CoA-transferase CaiB-like acyl-CoA transferase
MTLGDMGADVIKVEIPGSGDQSRGWGPPFLAGESAYYLSTNRNKRSLTLNIKNRAALDILHTLLDHADVIITNNPRADSLQKLGLDFDSLHARNPRLIACNITGFGMTGPYAGKPGYDMVAQAMSGSMSLTGPAENSEPYRFPTAMADITTGVYAIIGILGALLARQRTGEGDFIDVALLDSQITWLSYTAGNYFATGERPVRRGNTHPSIVPYDIFKTADRYILVAVGSEKLWRQFCQVLNLTEMLMDDPRFATNADRLAHRREMYALLSDIFVARAADEWMAIFDAAGIPCGPINSIDETFTDPQVIERGVIVELEHPAIGAVKSIANPVHSSGGQITYRRYPPLLGEHTDEILLELGKTRSEIDALRAADAI